MSKDNAKIKVLLRRCASACNLCGRREKLSLTFIYDLKKPIFPQSRYVCNRFMHAARLISVIAAISLFFISIITGTGCANIVPPSGGDRDSLPPMLVKVMPVDSAVNFKGNRITFTFDEYVQLDNFISNAVISPVPRNFPSPASRLNTVTIRLKDTLEPNTTYTINFGASIKDVNEGNIMRDFSYVFSTGPAIDSLTFRGNVVLAETGGVDTTLVVMLHRNAADSAVRNERPRYVTKLDSKGNFIFRNLPAGTFYVYALEDQSRSYRYIDPTKLFAFADSPIIVQQNTRPKTLYAYNAEKPRQSSSGSTSGKPNAQDRRLKFQSSLKNGNTQDLLQNFTLEFERPLKNFDSLRARLFADSSYTPVNGYSWILDSTRKKLTLNYHFDEDRSYHLILQKDFATDTLRQQLLRADTINFHSMPTASYGKLAIHFRNLEVSKNPVLQFVLNNTVVASYPLTSENFLQPLFLPGEYELRILYDQNKNGVWDPGIFYGRHKQPELVKPLSRKSVVVKQSWDNDYEIRL